ncbi:MAG: sodium:solute symporter family protein [Elusimicrobiota bacterium]
MKPLAGAPIDYWIIAAYFIGILVFGTVFSRYSRSTKDFFLGGQRFAWWLIAFSCVATVVGSYSFIKYSAAGFSYGLSATMTYTNDWFLVPLFALGWAPIIYFARVTSIPEYFEKRFNRPTRVAAVAIMMVYMIGYVGINFYTLGVALNALLGGGIFEPLVAGLGSAAQAGYAHLGGHVFGWAVVIAVVCSVYVTFGGQTAVIMTDLLQGILLLVAGFVLLILGVDYLGGWKVFWDGLPVSHRLPFSGFNQPAKFPFVGVFWQDLFGSSMAFYFANQGLIMRFLAAKSVKEGRKAIFAVVLILMPLAAVAVAGAGWVGKSMQSLGILPPDADPNKIFVLVSELVCRPGVFGLIMAALTAALMSTVDTLINACSAVFINDIWRPFVRPGRGDAHYLKVARVSSIAISLIGIALVPLFAQFKSIYVAHGAFTAAVTPPLITAIILAILWNRYTPWAAFATLTGGTLAMAVSLKWEGVIGPFAALHGIEPGVGYKYMRALYGFAACGAIAVVATLLTRPRKANSIIGLTVSTIPEGKRLYKGGAPNDREPGETLLLELKAARSGSKALLHPSDLNRLAGKRGDLIYVEDRRWWLGGLRSVHVTAEPSGAQAGAVVLPDRFIEEGGLRPGDQVRVQKVI